jgi:hypothetical protein
VHVGSVVRVFKVYSPVLKRLCGHDKFKVQSMLGQTFTVYEIDQWGVAWVEKWWHETEDRATSHSLGLTPEQMEIAGS